MTSRPRRLSRCASSLCLGFGARHMLQAQEVTRLSVGQVRNVGKTLVTRSSGMRVATDFLKGRIVEANLADLNKDEDQNYRKMKLQILVCPGPAALCAPSLPQPPPPRMRAARCWQQAGWGGGWWEESKLRARALTRAGGCRISRARAACATSTAWT